MYGRNPRLLQSLSPAEQRGSLPRDRDRFDYVEQVDTVSTLSTPNSTTENPFSKESLGDTVIHLDKVF